MGCEARFVVGVRHGQILKEGPRGFVIVVYGV